MLIDSDGTFMTQRKLPHLARVKVRLGPDALLLEAEGKPPLTVLFAPPQTGAIDVQIWRNVCAALPVSAEADAWFTAVARQPCRLVFMPESTRRPVNPKYAGPEDIVSFADGYPILVAGEASLEELNARLATPLPMDRFRPNLVVRGVPAHGEDDWRQVKFPRATLRGAKPCARCAVTTIDQSSGELRGPEPLRTLAAYRRGGEGDVLFGQNLLVEKTGTIRVGDEISPMDN